MYLYLFSSFIPLSDLEVTPTATPTMAMRATTSTEGAPMTTPLAGAQGDSLPWVARATGRAKGEEEEHRQMCCRCQAVEGTSMRTL